MEGPYADSGMCDRAQGVANENVRENGLNKVIKIKVGKINKVANEYRTASNGIQRLNRNPLAARRCMLLGMCQTTNPRPVTNYSKARPRETTVWSLKGRSKKWRHSALKLRSNKIRRAYAIAAPKVDKIKHSHPCSAGLGIFLGTLLSIWNTSYSVHVTTTKNTEYLRIEHAQLPNRYFLVSPNSMENTGKGN